ncbi:MAG: HEAT repeat domain-containing protein [Holophaga sp.]|nr:HEAT repeat domain-containing protein [Holophaga sp.]
MPSPLRKIPHTPLDTLRDLLKEFAEGDVQFPARLASQLQTLKKQALHELGSRLGSQGTPRGLRKAILGAVAKFDWPEWTPWISMALKTEQDLGIFDEGCAALGALGTRGALTALTALKTSRTEPDFQVILNRELGLFQSQQGAAYHISRLMEGQGNLRMAAQGAKLLGATAGAQDLGAIVEAYHNGDPLTQRLAIRVMGSLPEAGATAFLKAVAESAREDFLDHQLLLAGLNRLQTLQRASVLPELLRQTLAHFSSRHPETKELLAGLQRAAAQEEPDILGAVEDLRPWVGGVYETFLTDALALMGEGKVARYSAMVSDAAQSVEARLGFLTTLVDQVAEALAFKVDCGEITREEILPIFAPILRSRAGGDGFVTAFLRLLPVSETALLAELLKDPDITRREKYLDALGTREDDALTPFFLAAMEDPIVEVGQRAIHHLGKLPSSFPALMGMFESGQQDQVRSAIRVFGENRTRTAAEALLGFLQKDNRDALILETVEALSAIGYPGSAPVLLELLHDGKPLNLQIALADALKELGTPEASLGLLRKAPNLKQPQVLILALEGALTAFPGFDRPLPLDALPDFIKLFERCCDEREGEGQRLRAILASQELFVFDRPAYNLLKDRVSDFLFDMRTKETWDRESNDRVALVVKELARRGDGLGLLAQKEAGINAQIQKLPEKGPKKAEALLALREALADPELIIRPELAQTLAGVVLDLLAAPGAEWREVAHLCEIGGLTRQPGLVEPIREIYLGASGLGLKSAARAALLALGLTESDLNRRPPVRSVLLLEPSAFFRKRLAMALASGEREVMEAGSREEADAILASRTVDLVITESKDAQGDLAPWLEELKDRERFRYVLLSTANRDIAPLRLNPWVIGALFKPYPTEHVLQALEP